MIQYAEIRTRVANIGYTAILFWIFIVGYALLFLINPQLGGTDDLIFLRTLQIGKPLFYYSQDFPYYNPLTYGRFIPLASMEYNLVGLFSHQPFWYYFYHAIQFAVFIFLIVKIVKKFVRNDRLVYGMASILLLTPGFTISWFRLQLNERNVIFFLTVFLICYLAYTQNPKKIYFAGALLAANVAIYYKETAFIALGAFALFHIILSKNTSDRNIKRLDIALVLSSLLYIILYYFLAFKELGPTAYGSQAFNGAAYGSFITLLRNIFDYTFTSDPVLVLVVVPLALWRIYAVAIRREGVNPMPDAMLLASLSFFATYLVLNMFSSYYLLPAYAFALPSLLYFLTQDEYRKGIWRFAYGAALFILVANVLPLGINQLTGIKYAQANFNETLDFLKKEIKGRHSQGRVNIFLDGVDRTTSGGKVSYLIFAEFLQSKGLTSDEFDMRSAQDATADLAPFIYKLNPPFSVFQTQGKSQIATGDYVIVSPASKKYNNDAYLTALKKEYRLIFQTKSPFAFPAASSKTVVKYLIARYLLTPKNADAIQPSFMQTPDYYVLART